MSRTWWTIAVLAIAVPAGPARGEESLPRLANIFNDNMVLQGEQQYLWWKIDQYGYVFPAVVASFRQAFEDPQLPFGIITVQGNAHTKGNRTERDSVDRVCID